MSPKAELVRQISATAFTDAIDLMACLAVLRERESLVVPQALEEANASLAATIVQKALLQRVLMTVERAFAVNPRPSDRHARVAFEYLLDQKSDKVVAHAGERDPKIPPPLISELRNYAMGTADVLARLARGSGVVDLELGPQTVAYEKSAKAFWSVWRDRKKSR